MQMSKVERQTLSFLEARFKLFFASYLSESNFIQKAVVSFYSKFSQQKFVVWQQRSRAIFPRWRGALNISAGHR